MISPQEHIFKLGGHDHRRQRPVQANISTMVGKLYGLKDERRDSASPSSTWASTSAR
jgi:hypothetical protein